MPRSETVAGRLKDLASFLRAHEYEAFASTAAEGAACIEQLLKDRRSLASAAFDAQGRQRGSLLRLAALATLFGLAAGVAGATIYEQFQYAASLRDCGLDCLERLVVEQWR
jgi:hypothetical protein